MYQLRFKDNSRPIFSVTDNICTLGCAQDNTLVLNTSTVDESHARLIQHDGRLFLQDNKSRRGCFVNGKKVKYKELRNSDVVSIGNVHFDILEVEDTNLTSTRVPAVTERRSAVNISSSWRLVSDSSWLSGKVFELAGDSTLLGRGKDCDIVIPGNHLSRNHALILKQGNNLVLKDLDSSNGSHVNEIRIKGEQIIKPGDRLRFDVYSFRVQGPTITESSRHTQPETSGPRKLINLESTLQNIEALKSQEYQQKEWITKPTSHGNRYHEVPTRKHHLGMMFWISVVLGISVLSVLGYIVFNI
ncbi:MAG TPA: FHA domain-containing protein [Pseudomonadales bacterium]|nr:FHA domain-containing protein [Pseudomonadales bacterium]